MSDDSGNNQQQDQHAPQPGGSSSAQQRQHNREPSQSGRQRSQPPRQPPGQQQQQQPGERQRQDEQQQPRERNQQGNDRPRCPDYAAEEWEELRQHLIDQGKARDDEAAVALLIARWHERREGGRRQEAGEGRGRGEPEREEEERNGGEPRDQQERGRGRNVDRPSRPSSPTISTRSSPAPKGDNAHPPVLPKFIPIPLDKEGPDLVPDPPAEYAINRLRKGKYVELSYFTARGRMLAKSERLSGSESALALQQVGGAIAITSGVQPSKEARRDDQLLWSEVMQARVSYLDWLERCNWPADYVNMISAFFWNLESLNLRGQLDGTEVLVRYQAKYRWEWHQALERGDPWCLSNIKMSAIKEIQNDIAREKVEESLRQLNAEREALWRAGQKRRDPSPPSASHPLKRFRSSRFSSSTTSRRELSGRQGPARGDSFRSGASTSALVVCAICLGRHPISEVAKCNASSTWKGKPTRCAREGNRIVTHQGSPICINWQRQSGCNRTGHDERHECSGCGSRDHGAHHCPQAQTV